ncbi:MAG: hypothetical protein KJ593_07945 [Candidatus Omnitrophica bacterium]|nr:hypothetical protein [Candidatus Omnitrophota bacterium]
MGKGPKLIIIGLLILLLVSIFFLLQLFQQRQSFQQGYEEIKTKLNTQTSNWSGQVSRLKEDKEQLQVKISGLEKDINDLKGERDSAVEKYELLSKEKEELVGKLQGLALAKKEGPAFEPTQAEMLEPDEYWASILKSKADLELRLSDLKDVVSDLQLRLDKAEQEKNDLTLAVSQLEQNNQDMSRQVTYNERLAENLSKELMREQKDKKEILEQVKNIKQENISLRARIKEVDKTNFSLKNKLKRIDEERSQLDKKVEEMNLDIEKKIQEVTLATEEIKAMSGYEQIKSAASQEGETKGVELPPIIVKGEKIDAINDLRIISGKVIAINETNNFVVINLGENQGVTIGRKFDVYRNKVTIARLEVIQARKNISAADVINVNPKRDIRIGDTVR